MEKIEASTASAKPNTAVTESSRLIAAELGKADIEGTRPEESPIWMFFHAVFFLIGGFCFVAGTGCYYFPDWQQGGLVAAVLYTIGSVGFLSVDTQEALTFTKESIHLRVNIMCSWFGSLLYVVGSVGFLPDVYAWSDQVGIQGFIWGSFFIGCSQLWKTHRIGSDDVGFSSTVLLGTRENFTATGVELSAGLGAWCFFVGTIMYWNNPSVGPFSYTENYIAIWMLGSLLFTTGGCFLAYRHLNGM